MFVLRGSLLMELPCGSFFLHQISSFLPVTRLKAISLDVHGPCAVLLGSLSGNTSLVQIDTIKWIWSCGTVFFSHGEPGHTAQYWSACPWAFPGVPSQGCGHQPGCSSPKPHQQWQSCHQLLIRISRNGALLLWGPAQFSVETEGAASGKAQAEAQLLVLLPVVHRSVLWHR